MTYISSNPQSICSYVEPSVKAFACCSTSAFYISFIRTASIRFFPVSYRAFSKLFSTGGMSAFKRCGIIVRTSALGSWRLQHNAYALTIRNVRFLLKESS